MKNDLEKRIRALVNLGGFFRNYSEGDDSSADLKMLQEAVEKAENENPWFTRDNIDLALRSWSEALQEGSVRHWVDQYHDRLSSFEGKSRVGVIMAGNIPMVGMHDMLCVFLTGHSASIKLSGQDRVLIPFIADWMAGHYPEWAEKCTFNEEKLRGFDSVIATGSNNSSRYFDYYFGKYPNIIRYNRNSIAVISGNETEEELRGLGVDIFSYFGLGCRNVSKIFVPKGYDFGSMIRVLQGWKDTIHHHKYANNYDYQKSILIINQVPFMDTGALLLREGEALVSPISVLHYEFYDDASNLSLLIERDREQIQCVTGSVKGLTDVPFGKSQFPALWDYADGIDTVEFLLQL